MTNRASEFFEKVAALGRERQSFAVATVVARRAPISAHLGDRAIVYADGRMDGFVGGACAREIVRKQALEALRARHARLVSISLDVVDAAASSPEHVYARMTCASEGAVDVYIEPFVEARRLVVVGATPVAEALARTALSLDYDVVRVVDARELDDLKSQAAAGITVAPLDSLEEVVGNTGGAVAAVVASQGHYDEEALQTILGCDVSYVGLVASRKRGDTIRAVLERSGVAGVEAIRYPAGLDLGARTSSEVALSILAEIVQASPAERAERSVGGHPTPAEAVPSVAIATALDPVCGMDVDLATARHMAEVDGTLYYFCCANCRVRFVNEPQRFLATRG